jgi:hypothetical protein
MAKQPAGKYGTNGGNGGYSKRKTMDMGLNKPLKLSDTGKFAATGKTKKTKD